MFPAEVAASFVPPPFTQGIGWGDAQVTLAEDLSVLNDLMLAAQGVSVPSASVELESGAVAATGVAAPYAVYDFTNVNVTSINWGDVQPGPIQVGGGGANPASMGPAQGPTATLTFNAGTVTSTVAIP
jgi:hypothetical protein